MINENYYGTFDWEKYIRDNKDLENSSIQTKEDAIFHYSNYGINENRNIFFFNNKNITYEIFDWKYYIENNEDIKKQNNITKEDAWEHYFNYGIYENRPINIILTCDNYEEILFDNFDWENYLKINKDILHDNIHIDKQIAWNHWMAYGLKENRAISYINNTNIHNGRFGNLFFINMIVHFISKKFDLKVNYKYFDKYKKLGIDFNLGNNIYRKNVLVTEKNCFNIIHNVNEPCNILITNDVWFQNKELCHYLRDYFNNNQLKNNIVKHNLYKNRYNNNNDVFIHLRLGDILDKTIGISNYYIKLLANLDFENGYISSDSIDNELAALLIRKFNLKIINEDEVNTIMFASTCKKIILSGGTFSWLIGFLSFFSQDIYYPKITNPWFGDIFDFSNWTCIS